MGRSKSNTGIGFIDTAVDNTINKGTNALAKNVERNTQRGLKMVGSLIKGDFNNLGSTAAQLTSPFSYLANPDDKTNITGDTNIDRAEKDAESQAQSDAAGAEAAVAAEKTRQQEAQIAGIVSAKKRAPGRAQTLISIKPSSNTLLSLN